NGIPFREVPSAPPGRPLLRLAAGQIPRAGTPLDPGRWPSVLACRSLAAQNEVPVREIWFDDRGELWLNIPTHRDAQEGERLLNVRLGRTEDLAEKLTQLRLVLPSAGRDGEYLDLMCPGRAAYRKTDGAGAERTGSDVHAAPSVKPRGGESRRTAVA